MLNLLDIKEASKLKNVYGIFKLFYYNNGNKLIVLRRMFLQESWNLHGKDKC